MPSNEWMSVLIAVTAGLAGLAAGAFGGLRQVLDAYLTRWKKRIERPPLQGIGLLSKLADLYGVFYEAKSIPTVERALVFVGHNCGGLPTPGGKYVVRAQLGWGNRYDDVVRRFAFDLVIDDEDVKVLEEVHRVGQKLLNVETMPPCLLRSIYLREKVKHSVLFALCRDEEANQFGYLSFASYTGPFSEDDLSGLVLVASRMRELLTQLD